MRVPFGATVFGNDGQRLGEVEGLVVDAGTKRARAIVVDPGGLRGGKRMIEVSALRGRDQQSLLLDETGAAATAEEEVIGTEEVSFEPRAEPPTTYVPAGGVGGPTIVDAPPVPGEYPDSKSFFDVAPIDAPVVEVESNLGPSEVILGRGTNVVSKDHHNLGKATSFDLGDMGTVNAVTVSEGLVFRKSVDFSLSEIDEFDTEAVHLRLARAEAERGDARGEGQG
jgi:hypothetical protein